MKFVTLVYNGFYYLYLDSGLTSRPDFSAWAACTFTALSYVCTFLLIIGKFYDDKFGEDSFPFGTLAFVCGVGIALLSDWNIQHTWFGARHKNLQGRSQAFSKIVSLGLLIGGWLGFIGIGFAIYY